MNERGECVVADSEIFSHFTRTGGAQVSASLSLNCFKAAFDGACALSLKAIETCVEGCPYGHYKPGLSIVCYWLLYTSCVGAVSPQMMQYWSVDD